MYGTLSRATRTESAAALKPAPGGVLVVGGTLTNSGVVNVDIGELEDYPSNALPGFFSLNSTAVEMQDPLAKEFVSWRETCHPTIRSTYQILSRGTPNLENETWNASANVLRGSETPEAAAERLQQGLASWYEPQKAK